MKKLFKAMFDWLSKEKKLVGFLILGLALGLVLANVFQGPKEVQRTADHEASQEVKTWTCSMHPQIQLPSPGKCPICGMNLIALVSTEAGAGTTERMLVMSEAARKLAKIQVSRVERKTVELDVRMVGKVEYDETKTAFITAWTGGRIDKLYINQTGIPVRKGDHLAYMYSPELLSAQEEYLQALESVQEVKESHLDIIKSTSK